VAAGSHGDEKIALARETDGRTDVGGAGAARDEPGMTIDRTVPDRAGGVVLRVAGTDELSTEVLRQVGEGRIVKSGSRRSSRADRQPWGTSLLLAGWFRPAGYSTKNGLATRSAVHYPQARMKGYGQVCG
jgi:hypothetical protein